jgi:uncharacterized membrane protein
MTITDDVSEVEERFLSTERLMFFSDAVVAIAMTLLALELPIHDVAEPSNRALLDFFWANRGEYLAFFISFAVVAAQWGGHHRTFANVTHLAGRLVGYNMLWLLTIVVTPFATKVLTGDGAFQVRFITYAGVQALSGIFFLLMIRELSRHGLRKEATPRRSILGGYVRLIAMTSAFLISIPVSLFTHAAYVCWIAIPVLMRLGVVLVDRRERRKITRRT